MADLTSGLPQSKTAEENLALWDLAERIRQSEVLTQLFTTVMDAEQLLAELARSAEGAAFLVVYRNFLTEYGHRGHADRDFSLPRWGEDPRLSISLLRMFVKAGGDIHPRAMMERLLQRRKTAEAEVEHTLRRQPLGAIKTWLFKILVDYVQRMLVLRDNQRFYLDIITMGEKRSFQEFGRRLAERGVLQQPNDVYFVSREEVYDAASGILSARDTRRRVDVRSREFHAAQAKMPPKYLQGTRESDDAVSPTTTPADAHVLSGLGTSSGVGTGTARVVVDLAEIGRIQKGDILITNSTDPGWTPVFLILGGLVMETGGVLAHGSLISREHGIPAVSCVKDATKLIRDGEPIVVDGTRGQVTLSERAAGDKCGAQQTASASRLAVDASWTRPLPDGALSK